MLPNVCNDLHETNNRTHGVFAYKSCGFLSEGEMSRWLVKLTIRKMGMQCATCKQEFETVVTACSAEMAVRLAKDYSRANQETHKFTVNIVKEIEQ